MFMGINEINKLLNSNYESIDSFEKNATWEKDIEGKPINKIFAKEFSHKINWDFVSYYYNLDEDFIRFHQNRVNWYRISHIESLSENFICEFQNKVNWKVISSRQKLSEKFINEFKDRVDWYYISEDQILSEDFIRKFQNKIKWHSISSKQKLSEKFINEFEDKVTWSYIAEDQILSEDFIEKYTRKGLLSWSYVVKYQNLSEEFIEEFIENIDITSVLYYQNVSIEFVERHKHKINWRDLSYQKNYNKELFERYAKYLDWLYISKYWTLSEEFIEEFQDKIEWYYIGKYYEYSVSFIRKHSDRLKTAILKTDNLELIRELKDCISFDSINYLNFPEDLLIEFKDKVNWLELIKNRKLSERLLDLCNETFNPRDWTWISDCQRLSENFIRKFQDKVHWGGVCRYQTLSEDFMEEFSEKIWWGYIIKYQKLSTDFIDKYIEERWDQMFFKILPYQKDPTAEMLSKDAFFLKSYKDKFLNTWLYKTTEFRKEKVLNSKLYECHEDFFIAEILVDVNKYRPHDFHFQFNKDEIIEIFATQTDEERPKGFEVGLFDNLCKYYFGDVDYEWTDKYYPLRVKVNYENVVHLIERNDYTVIRCEKLQVLD